MDLTLGCKEKTDSGWVYSLKQGGKTMTQKEWWALVEQEISARNHQGVLQRILDALGSKRWTDKDTPYDFALQIYAAKYCTNVQERVSVVGKSHTKSVKSINSQQLSLV